MKTLATTLLAATLAMLSGCSGAGDDAEYGDWSTATVEGQPCQIYYRIKPLPGSTFTWSGACVDGKTSGRGRLVVRFDGNEMLLFEGEMRAGKPYGWVAVENQECQIFYPSTPSKGMPTFTWSGACADGKTSGRGRLVARSPDGKESVFEGKMRDGKRHGHGVSTNSSGARYEGEYRDGKAHGHGVETNSSGARYEGEFREGMRHGDGVETNSSGARYEGEYRDGDVYNGQGVETLWRSGTRVHYEGEFRDGEPNGQGVMVGPAARYEGELRDGKAHGQGVMVFRNQGTRYEGEFRNDKLYSGVYVCADGTRKPCSKGRCAWCPDDLW